MVSANDFWFLSNALRFIYWLNRIYFAANLGCAHIRVRIAGAKYTRIIGSDKMDVLKQTLKESKELVPFIIGYQTL